MAPSTPPSPSTRSPRRLRLLEARYDRLREKLRRIGYLAAGTVTKLHLRCGKKTCSCQRDARKRHGPYYYWTTKVKGRTVARKLTPSEARLYLDWIGNRRKLDRTVAQMVEVSRDVAALLLQNGDAFIPGR